MEIAKGVQSYDYQKLDLSSLKNPDWLVAIDYLERRLSERFVEPAQVLIDAENGKRASEKKFGFAILAIDCLLAETIQSFYEGITDSTGQSKQIFQRFLRNRDAFRSYFTTDAEAADFYKHFRCGILHQAQTTGGTRVWTVGNLIERSGSSVIVNRDLFHEKIKEELGAYLLQLRKCNNNTLANNFKTKMNFIVTS